MLLTARTAIYIHSSHERYAYCERLMSLATDEDSTETATTALLNELKQLNIDLEVPTPKDYGIDKERYFSLLPTMAEQALASGSPSNNPRVPTKDEIIELYKQVWD